MLKPLMRNEASISYKVQMQKILKDKDWSIVLLPEKVSLKTSYITFWTYQNMYVAIWIIQ